MSPTSEAVAPIERRKLSTAQFSTMVVRGRNHLLVAERSCEKWSTAVRTASVGMLLTRIPVLVKSDIGLVIESVLWWSFDKFLLKRTVTIGNSEYSEVLGDCMLLLCQQLAI